MSLSLIFCEYRILSQSMIFVNIAYASSEGSDKPVQTIILTRTFAARMHKEITGSDADSDQQLNL